MSTPFPHLIPGQLRIDSSCPSPGVFRVAAFGEIDMSTADVLGDRLIEMLTANHPGRIEVDLAGVTFMDCSGLTALLTASNVAAQLGGELRITNPQSIVQRILDITGLRKVLAAPFAERLPAAGPVGMLIAV